MNAIYTFINKHRTIFWYSIISINILAALDNYVYGSGITGTVFLAMAALIYIYKEGGTL
jgi:hypothetical protein